MNYVVIRVARQNFDAKTTRLALGGRISIVVGTEEDTYRHTQTNVSLTVSDHLDTNTLKMLMVVMLMMSMIIFRQTST